MKKTVLTVCALLLCLSMTACATEVPPMDEDEDATANTTQTNMPPQNPDTTPGDKPDTAPTADPNECTHEYYVSTRRSYCTEPAVADYTCTRCNDQYSAFIPAGHCVINHACVLCDKKANTDLSFVLSDDGLSYRVAGMGTCTDTDIIIPEKYNDLPVTDIKDLAFENQTELQRVTIPSTVLRIGFSAFRFCYNLESVYIEQGVTVIEKEAFRDCGRLNNIHIPPSVTAIRNAAFANCGTFTELTIPHSVKTIEDQAFSGCNALLKIEVKPANPNYCSIDGNLYSKDQSTLIRYANGKTDTSFSIPQGVVYIGTQAFTGAAHLTRITIPDSVTEIGEYAFSSCTAMEQILIPKSVTVIRGYAFSNCSTLQSIDLPDQLVALGENAFGKCTALVSIVIPDPITWINPSLLIDCSALESVTLPAGVSSIQAFALAQCANLHTVHFKGTMEQWNAMSRNGWWNHLSPFTVVHCIDGDVTI